MARKPNKEEYYDNLPLTDYSKKQRDKARQEQIRRERSKKIKDRLSSFD